MTCPPGFEKQLIAQDENKTNEWSVQRRGQSQQSESQVADLKQNMESMGILHYSIDSSVQKKYTVEKNKSIGIQVESSSHEDAKRQREMQLMEMALMREQQLRIGVSAQLAQAQKQIVYLQQKCEALSREIVRQRLDDC